MIVLFWFKKIGGLFFMPLQFALLIGGLGVLFIWLQKNTPSARLACAGRIMATLAILVLALASNRAIALRLARPLESLYPPVPELPPDTSSANPSIPTRLAACKYVLVLGSGHGDDPARSRITQLSVSGRARLTEGIRILRALPPDAKLVVSGYHLTGASHAQVCAEAAISLGVDPARIIRMDNTRDTDDEIHGIATIANGAPFALVTSAWHMPRAIDMCARQKLDAYPCPTDFLLPSSENEGALTWLRFELGAFECSSKAIRERIGRLFLLKDGGL